MMKKIIVDNGWCILAVARINKALQCEAIRSFISIAKDILEYVTPSFVVNI